MTDIPAGKGGGPSPFVNAFDHPQLNSLRYNTSEAGSPLHLCYGTQRVSVSCRMPSVSMLYPDSIAS